VDNRPEEHPGNADVDAEFRLAPHFGARVELLHRPADEGEIGGILEIGLIGNGHRGGFLGADEMGNMFQVYRDFEAQVLGRRSADVARQLNPSLQTFDAFVAKNKAKIQAATEPAPAAT
jgi:hypothetical protein